MMLIHVRAMRAYLPGHYDGRVHLFWPEEDRTLLGGDNSAGWRRFVRDFAFDEIPGGHVTCVRASCRMGKSVEDYSRPCSIDGWFVSQAGQPGDRLNAPSLLRHASHGASRHPRTLATGEVHLRLVNLDDMDVSDALDVLSSDERERAARLHSGQDRDRFISARGLLRGILAEYVGSNARDLVFGYGPHGKPRLVTNPKDVSFNLSHSSNHVIFAFTVGQEIGVDLERLDSIAEAASIADQFFSAIESSRISHSPQNQRARTFLSYWTCKEALAKAIGVGMSHSITDHEFNFDASGQPRLANGNLPGHWSLRTVRLDAEYAISFAIAGPIKSIKFLRESWAKGRRVLYPKLYPIC